MIGYFFDVEDIPLGLEGEYIFWAYTGGNSWKISYNVVSKGALNVNRSFICWATTRLDENWDICFFSKYEINSKEFSFNKSLRGKDPVYDWVMKNMPSNREESVHIEFDNEEFEPDLVIY
jgi:hypothetical protein